MSIQIFTYHVVIILLKYVTKEQEQKHLKTDNYSYYLIETYM